MITYQLISGGYEILRAGVAIIHQPHSPNRGQDVFLSETAAEQIAKLCVTKLDKGTSPVVLPEEEMELLNPVSEQRIEELATNFAIAEEARRLVENKDLEAQVHDLQQLVVDLSELFLEVEVL